MKLHNDTYSPVHTRSSRLVLGILWSLLAVRDIVCPAEDILKPANSRVSERGEITNDYRRTKSSGQNLKLFSDG